MLHEALANDETINQTEVSLPWRLVPPGFMAAGIVLMILATLPTNTSPAGGAAKGKTWVAETFLTPVQCETATGICRRVVASDTLVADAFITDSTKSSVIAVAAPTKTERFEQAELQLD